MEKNKPEEDYQLNDYRSRLIKAGGCLLSLIWLSATIYGLYALIRDLFL